LGSSEIPILATFADLGAAALALGRGDEVGAGLSLLAAIPLVGAAFNGAKWAKRGRRLRDGISKEAHLLRTGGNGTTVTVRSKAEADALLKEAFPDYQKVNGVGSQDPAGIRKGRKLDRYKEGGAYHKDYSIDPSTGRVRGHDPSDLNGEFPHINIKRKDKKTVLIKIIK
ncbi:MAG: hypothetical protein AAF998_24605, partial [Bacteroidota bacterium]